MAHGGFRWLGAVALVVGCGTNGATTNRTFYHWALGDDVRPFERRVPELDHPLSAAEPRFLGVSVLSGGVSFSRPRDWRLRQASLQPDEPYVHYVSPQAYSFAIYRRPDSPADPWTDLRERFEEDVSLSGARVVGAAVPMAVARGKGFAYSIERDVPTASEPLLSRSREMLLRDEALVVLVQIVHHERDFSRIDDELLRVVESLRLH